MPVYHFGTGAGLSLRVNAYESFPLTAAENTIGILTDTPITKYVFSAVQPEDPAEGMVWIKTGLESTTPIPVSAKNSAFLFPIGASRYQNGAWTKIASEDVRCYRGGWKMWRKYLFNEGDTCGFTYNRSGSGGSMVIGDGKMDLTAPSRVNAVQPVATAGYSGLVMDYTGGASLSPTDSCRAFGLNIDYKDDVSDPTFSTSIARDGTRTTLDLSAIPAANYFFKLKIQSTGHLQVYRIWLEG